MTTWAVEHEEIGRAVCRALRSCRLEAGLTQKDVAGLAGLSVYELSRIENGRRIPSYAVAGRVGDACGFHLTIRLQKRES